MLFDLNILGGSKLVCILFLDEDIFLYGRYYRHLEILFIRTATDIWRSYLHGLYYRLVEILYVSALLQTRGDPVCMDYICDLVCVSYSTDTWRSCLYGLNCSHLDIL
jgi:hypothetical protein